MNKLAKIIDNKRHSMLETIEAISVQHEKLSIATGYWDLLGTQLVTYNPFDADSSSTFFDSRFMFGLDGFDVVIGNPPYIQIQKFKDNPIQKKWEQEGFETFAKTGDVYCLFYEKAYQLIKPNGVLAFITSNKWMRTAYGKKLRRFFCENTQPLTIIDFSSHQVFESATVDTNVLLFRKQANEISVKACLIDKNYTKTTPLGKYVESNSLDLEELSDESWVITTKAEYAIKKRIEEVGIPLKDWDVSINYGIKTGFNEAFIIDGAKKDELITQDPKSAEIIKPILRGRNIKRYKVEFADLWLIDVHNGFESTPAINIENYTVVKNHLEEIESKRANGDLGGKAKKAKGLYGRDDQGKTPFNLRNCAYHAEFEKEKIVWQEMVNSNCFMYDRKGFFCNDTARIMTGEHVISLLPVLNSELFYFLIKTFYGGGGLGEGVRMKHTFMEQCPIPEFNSNIRSVFKLLAKYIQTIESIQSMNEYFQNLSNALVYELYFPEEFKTENVTFIVHLGDLSEISDDTNNKENIALIENEYTRLNHPDHPIDQNLDKLNNVEVVRTIREALNK